MSTIGDKLLGKGRPRLGVGVSLDPASVPVEEDVVYAKFTGGLDMSDAPEGLALDRACHAIDMEVTRNDRIIRSPGIELIEDVSPRDLTHIFTQANIDYAAEMVVVDPPFLGVKADAGFAWYDLGIGTTDNYGWPTANVLNTLLFSNGINKTYTRGAGAAAVTEISDQVIARAFAVAFGRVFAGGYVAGGNFQGMGIQWNAANGSISDWVSEGAGAEFLLDDTTHSDKIIAMQGIGDDVLGVLCRNSLWVGLRTGQYDRPADFKHRVGGIGCFSRKSADRTPGGVTFLSDEGVVSFNANSAEVISGAINSELLPLDYDQAEKYVGTYQAQGMRYHLVTPFAHWIYEFAVPGIREARWFRRSAVMDNVLAFSEQQSLLTWATAPGLWSGASDTWLGLLHSQIDAPSKLYFTKGTKLGRESYGEDYNLGDSLAPVWRTPYSSKVRQTDVITTVGFEIQYASTASAVLQLSSPDMDGNFNNAVARVLPSTDGVLVRRLVKNVSTGMGVAAQLEVIAGQPQIAHVRQIYQQGGPGLVVL